MVQSKRGRNNETNKQINEQTNKQRDFRRGIPCLSLTQPPTSNLRPPTSAHRSNVKRLQESDVVGEEPVEAPKRIELTPGEKAAKERRAARRAERWVQTRALLYTSANTCTKILPCVRTHDRTHTCTHVRTHAYLHALYLQTHPRAHTHKDAHAQTHPPLIS